MKTKLFLLAVLFSFYSCLDNATKQREVRSNADEVNGYLISTIEYDSCEYLISGMGYSQMMTHKGNCKFCEKRHFLK